MRKNIWRGVGAFTAGALFVGGAVGCTGDAEESTAGQADPAPNEATMASWAPETDVEAGELVTSFEADGVTVDVFQVGVIPSPMDSGLDSDDTPIVQEGDDVAVLNLVFTNTGDPIDITYISAQPVAYLDEERIDVESLSLSNVDLGAQLTQLGLSPDWSTQELEDNETVTFETNTIAARPLVVEYVPEADMFVKVSFPRPQGSAGGELLTTP